MLRKSFVPSSGDGPKSYKSEVVKANLANTPNGFGESTDYTTQDDLLRTTLRPWGDNLLRYV